MTEGPELKFKYSADVEGFKKANQEVKEEVRSLAPEVKKTTDSVKGYSDILGKAASIGSGIFATSLLAIGKAVYNANEQVKNFYNSINISGGIQESFARNLQSVQGIADKYKKSIFALGEGFTQLIRETRGTINEGAKTEQIFDDLTSVSGKLGYQVGETTSHLTGFLDKMKQGTVDSTNLTDELDKRLYEAFIKVADGMNVTAAELNEVLKNSDEAANTILPALTTELSKALGEVPQSDAVELGDKIEYAQSKLTLFLDGLFKTSGAKSALAVATEDAGDFLDTIDKINRQHGIMAAGGAAIVAGAIKGSNAISGLNIEFDPFGYRASAQAEGERKAINSATQYKDGTPIGWSKSQSGDFKLPSQYAQAEFDIAGEVAKNRIEAEEKANNKLMAEQKRQAAERKRNLDAITRQEIQDSNERIRQGIQAAEDAVAASYANRPSSGISGKMLGNTGNIRSYDMEKDKFHTEFSNPVVGPGTSTNYDAITAQINSMTQAWWNEKRAKDASNASSAEMSLSLEALNKQLGEMLVNSSVDFFSGFAEGIGEITVNTGGIEKVSNRMAMVFGDMISQTGKSILAYGITMSGLQKALLASFTNPAVAIAVGAAAMIAGGALKAAATKNQSSGMSRMWTGGIADGAMGIDMVPTMLTAGEMVLTGHDQRNLYGMISAGQAANPNMHNYNGSSSRNGMRIAIELQSELRGSNIYQASRKGAREQKYFE